MKKGIAIVLIIVALLLGAGGVFIGFYIYNQHIVEEFTEQVTYLQGEIDAIGPIAQCYTYKSDVKKGQLITEDMIELRDIPQSLINESYITNKSEITGKYSKVTILRGTPITADVVMEDDVLDEKALYNTIREYDIVVNLWPIGLEIGDYVDMRIMMPRGEEYIVLSHMRIQGMSQSTVRFLLTEPQINIYQSALVDYYLNSAEGVMLYFTKYIEPGVQDPAIVTYKVNEDIMTAMRHNPNLYPTAWASVYDTVARQNIDKDLIPYEDVSDNERTPQQAENEEISTIAGGRSAWASSIAGSDSSYEDEASLAEKEKDKDKKGGSSW